LRNDKTDEVVPETGGHIVSQADESAGRAMVCG
jgi:hypothetical protein